MEVEFECWDVWEPEFVVDAVVASVFGHWGGYWGWVVMGVVVWIDMLITHEGIPWYTRRFW